ncbi:MAG: hypothetical protein RIT35_1121, partial [Pseudomonadota bacterium]
KNQWHHVASWFLYFGTISSLFTVIAGLIAASTVEHEDNVHEIMEHHEHIGLTILILAVSLSLWRIMSGGLISRIGNPFHLMLSALLCALIIFGADLGGLMVYQYGVAVKAAQAVAVSDNTTQNTTTPPANEAPVASNPIAPPVHHHHHHHKHAH